MQARIRTVIMRGGTSRGIFFRDEDLPVDPKHAHGLFWQPSAVQIAMGAKLMGWEAPPL